MLLFDDKELEEEVISFETEVQEMYDKDSWQEFVVPTGRRELQLKPLGWQEDVTCCYNEKKCMRCSKVMLSPLISSSLSNTIYALKKEGPYISKLLICKPDVGISWKSCPPPPIDDWCSATVCSVSGKHLPESSTLRFQSRLDSESKYKYSTFKINFASNLIGDMCGDNGIDEE